jgi:MerR family mercuric resistance operon transcriptional regulator
MRTITASRAEAFPIGELAKRSGVKIETIRYYERAKMLVPPADRDALRQTRGQLLAFIQLASIRLWLRVDLATLLGLDSVVMIPSTAGRGFDAAR